MSRIEEPRQSSFRPLADLAEPLDVTPAAVYRAADLGLIGGTIRAGRSRKISAEAFEFHREFGYGVNIPPASTPEASGYAAGRRVTRRAG